MRVSKKWVTGTRVVTLVVVAMFTILFSPSAKAGPPVLKQSFCSPSGSAPGQCQIPRGVATGPNGDIYVADQQNDRMQRFSAWGEFLGAWGSNGTGRGDFDQPQGADLDSAGNVYVIDRRNSRVQKFNSEGDFILMFGGEVNETSGGNVCPRPGFPADVCKAGVQGGASGFFGGLLVGSYIAVGPSDKIYVGDQERIQVFNSDGVFQESIALQGEGVQSLAVDTYPLSPSYGDIYVAYVFSESPIKGDREGIHKFSPTGTPEGVLPATNPRALAIDASNGDVYVANKPAGNLGAGQLEFLRFDAKGNLLESFAKGDLEETTGMATSVPITCGLSGTDLIVSNSVDGNSFGRIYGPPPDPSVCPPPALAPSIDDQFVTAVDTTGATLRAKINPHFWPDTRYYVQYGTGKCSEGGCASEQPASPGSLLSHASIPPDADLTTLPVVLEGLSPNTTYHYRFVAESGFDEVHPNGPVFGLGGAESQEGEEGSVHTPPLPSEPEEGCPNDSLRNGASARLPDCRAYELVSPLDKANGDVATGVSSYPQASLDGNGVVYQSQRSFPGSRSAPLFSYYLARRGAEGWFSMAISAPRSSIPFYPVGFSLDNYPYRGFSPDLCWGWFIQDSPLALVQGAPPGVPNLYRRNLCGGGAEGEAAYQLFSSAPPPGIEGTLANTVYVPEPQGFSVDGSRVVVRANAALATTPGGPRPPLRCNDASGTGTPSYQWLRDGFPIGAATEPTYTPTAADEGHVVQCRLTASNAEGASIFDAEAMAIAPVSTSPVPPSFGTRIGEPKYRGLPALSGIPAVGETLTCTPGPWKGNPTFTYRWYRNGAQISGAETATYEAQGIDRDKALQCETMGSNAAGTAVATSEGELIEAKPPLASAAPSITGTATIGQQLTCEPGNWSGSPIFAYQWTRNGANIGSAVASTYMLETKDEGKAIQCKVTAISPEGSTAAISAATIVGPPPPAVPPALTTAPSVTGIMALGEELTCGTGNWSVSPTEFKLRWTRDGANISPPQTASTYELQEADIGHSVQCQVSAVNAGGAVIALSTPRHLPPDPPVGYADSVAAFQTYVADSSGALRLVSVLPDGSVSTRNSSAGTTLAAPGEATAKNSVHRAVSANGERVFWTDGSPFGGAEFNAQGEEKEGALYLRLNATQPQSAISSGQCAEPAKACTIPVSASTETRFVDANPQGTRVIYTVGDAELFEAQIEETGGHWVAAPHLIAAGLKGVMGSSKDLERVYLASTEALSGTQENSEGEVAVAGHNNLYLYEVGAGFTFISALSDVDARALATGSALVPSPMAILPSNRASRVSPDGLHAAFLSTARLTGYDNTARNNGEAAAEAFVFDAEARDGEGALVCASCVPSQARPLARNISNSGQPDTIRWAAAEIPGWSYQTQPTQPLSTNGRRLFFDSFDALVPSDTNGATDVYEWEAPGEGGCTEQSSAFSQSNDGCVYLISSGKSTKGSEFFDADPDGKNVFFATDSSLVKQDYGLIDLYDARSDGGFSEPSGRAASCEGEACQGTTAAPNDPTPASSAFEGPGNVREGSGKSRCTKGRVRKKGRCVKRHKAHESHAKRVKRHKAHKHHSKRASHDRRNAR